MPTSWTEKYRPKKLSEVVGHSTAINNLRKFIDTFKNQKNMAVLLCGPPGCGKTVIVNSLANDYDVEIVELNASDLRNKDSIKNMFGAASKQASLVSKGKILLADEIDGVSGTSDRGGVPALVEVIKETSFPIILTANDPYLPKLRSLRKYCTLIKLNKLNYISIKKRLEEICKKEKVSYDELTLKKLAVSADGDLRAAINDLQTMAQGKSKITDKDLNKWSREREETIFNSLKLIFKSFDSKVALDSSDGLTEDLDVLNYWLDENIYKEYRDKKDNRDAYTMISFSNIFLSRIMRWQHWRFLVYSKYLSVAGVQQAKSQSSGSFNMYQRPHIMNWMFQQGMKRRKIKSDLRIATEKLHASSSNLNKSFWPYYLFIKEHNKKLGKELDKYLEIPQ
ncbi:MAG: replication factor C large subunit [Candidatus Woesearchaeota archaeon]|nr:MAG: replication factor C large subunit [Candidatus Woesearchaeota archaeon]